MKARTNAEWLVALKASGEEQIAALTDLRAHLLRAALFSLYRSRNNIEHLTASAIRQLAEDCTQEALLAILSRLQEFRGESQFTTWAYTFAVNTALVAARRERWKRLPLDQILEHPGPAQESTWKVPAALDPDRNALQGEVLAAVREAVEYHLTERQRQVLKAVIFEGIPLDEVARYRGSTRNAVYKVLHDARRRLKAYLSERGLDIRDLLDELGGKR
jgi:RNA polymerase sigma-70 factor (ECF subfamily)